MNTVYKKIALAGFCAVISASALAGSEPEDAAPPADAAAAPAVEAPAADAAAPAADASATAPADAASAAAAPVEAAPADATAPAEAAAVEAAPADAAPSDAAPADATAYAGSEGAPADGAPADESWFHSLFSDFDVSFGGFIRPEAAFSTGDANPNNQTGNPYNKITVTRQAYVPPTTVATATNNVLAPISLSLPVPAVGTWTTIPATSDTVRRPIAYNHDTFNMHIIRGEVEMGMKFTNDLKFIARVRAIYDPGKYKDFDENDVSGIYGGITGGDPALYQGRPNYFQYRVEGNKHPNPLEWAGKNYLVYFPTMLFDYNHGPLNVRVGNQQIAWGQAIFFRVLDVVDGLDLRRHSVLDYAQEEFSDKRVPALALRVGYQFSDELLVDGYAQKFQPTIYGNPNTQYNVIPAQFTVHDRYDDFENKISYGMRLKGNYGQWGFQAMAVRRYNPDGVFRWTQSGVNKALPTTVANGAGTSTDGGLNILGTAVNLANTTNPGGSGGQLAQTPFEASPGGVYSANEWFHYAAMVRLNGVTGLNAAINDFAPATTNVFASPVGLDGNAVKNATGELNTFFTAAGGSLRGHIERQYFAENNFGLGVSYVTEGEPGSIFDQLIINLENTYTPNRVFTSPDLGKGFLKENNNVTALVMEKYHRFTQAFPATYFVLQYMHRTKDDLFGRSLKGYGGDDNGPGKGINGANYVVFAFQQPFPQDIYRIGFATLYDPKGGILVQPGIVWKPRGSLSFDFFYSYINGHLGGNPNNNALSTADFADEATIRVSYQF